MTKYQGKDSRNEGTLERTEHGDHGDEGLKDFPLIRGDFRQAPAELIAELRCRRSQHYIGYYENDEGQSLIFLHPDYSETGMLYHGGRDWERFQVVEGVVRQPVLKHAERAWLAACWHSSSRQRELKAEMRASGVG